MGLEARGVDNDTRGWILSSVSGVACVFGASIICVDVLVRLIPGKANFRIQDSNIFLACSLSLSFGVMLFSSLFSMLPESKEYFKQEGWTDQAAGLVMMGFFAIGFVGIQVVSRLVHRFMPSHVVDCDHSHDDTASHDGHSHHTHSDRARSRSNRGRRMLSRAPDNKISDIAETSREDQQLTNESTPLLSSESRDANNTTLTRQASARDEMIQRSGSPLMLTRSRTTATGDSSTGSRRPSILEVQKRVMSFVKDTKANCDESGPCYGYTDPCGQECFKHISSRAASNARPLPALRTASGHFQPHHSFPATHDHNHTHADTSDTPVSPSRVVSRDSLTLTDEETDENGFPCEQMDEGDMEAQHHHHVPANAFLAIGLQTSIAIALHKFPEGFITYATNHANPALGLNVFMALFVHNISEGFAMALPLYMALNSRLRAMVWSALLGGLSQPFGAGIAALWFKLAKRTHMTPNGVAYGCLFALTSGIMVSVGLQLFVESLSLNHDRNMCMFFAFLGMSLLGLSNALFADH